MAAAAMAGIQVASAYGQSEAIKSQADYQNTMLRINIKNAEKMSDKVIEKGEASALNYQKKINQAIGSQKAAAAASGVEVGYGSAAKLVEETRLVGKEDIDNIRTNAFLEAMGYKSEAQDMARQGRMMQVAAQTQANQTLLAGGLSAAKAYATGGF